MSEHPIQGLMDTAMQKLRQLVDANTIVGQPIEAGDTIIIPVSKVSFGFASGGSDLPTSKPKELFGGGSGGGVSINPIAFIAITNGNVKLLQIDASGGSTADRLVDAVPELIDKVSGIIKTEKAKKSAEKADAQDKAGGKINVDKPKHKEPTE
ncbi:GerW family sporulation protein [Candidatus Soleaferrea massiliensis]|uniref:GerW family sporulation protein n=1 Tax=Candidatus Soleaferrea massiliensis TaxID=1470354 RepID=UPI00058C367C|nr:GerW family sporulation protein [Candidatus Soleaferrea massiliensis]